MFWEIVISCLAVGMVSYGFGYLAGHNAGYQSAFVDFQPDETVE